MSQLQECWGILWRRFVRDTWVFEIDTKRKTILSSGTDYIRAFCAVGIQKVTIPLLCVNAEDDPICVSDAIPFHEALQNPKVILCTTKAGGHLAYYEDVAFAKAAAAAEQSEDESESDLEWADELYCQVNEDQVDAQEDVGSPVEVWSTKVVAEFAQSVFRMYKKQQLQLQQADANAQTDD